MPRIKFKDKNVRIKTDGKKLTIEIDLTKKGHTSKSGKSRVIAGLGARPTYLGDLGKGFEKYGLTLNLFKIKGEMGGKKKKKRRKKDDSSD